MAAIEFAKFSPETPEMVASDQHRIDDQFGVEPGFIRRPNRILAVLTAKTLAAIETVPGL